MTEAQRAEPRIEYARRREARHAEAARQMQRFRTFRILRLAALVAGLTLGWVVYEGWPPGGG